MSWLSQIEKDLKGKPLSSLDWAVEPGILMKPFYTREDLGTPPPPLPHRESGNPWRICERIANPDAQQANAQALDALTNGANMLWIDLPEGSGAEYLAELLRDVQLPYIFTVFWGENPAEIAAQLPAQNAPFEAAFLGKKNTSGFWGENRRNIFFDGRKNADLLPSQQLAAVFSAAKKDFAQSIAEGNGATFTAQTLVALPVGDHYLVEIGKLRAFKHLWLRLLELEGLPPALPHLHVETTNTHEDPHANMIAAATQALSAAVAGADSLWVMPANGGSDAFHRRIARNVQHVLQMESGLDIVADPAAGSYFLEKLTQELVELVWASS